MDWDGKTERRNGLNHLRELFELRVRTTEKALELQAKEYERRLEGLNNEAERLRDMASTYLPRELYESRHNELAVRINGLEKIVYVGMGILLTLQFLLHFLK